MLGIMGGCELFNSHERVAEGGAALRTLLEIFNRHQSTLQAVVTRLNSPHFGAPTLFLPMRFQMLFDILSFLLKAHPLNLATDLLSDFSHGLYSIKWLLNLHRRPPPEGYGSLTADILDAG